MPVIFLERIADTLRGLFPARRALRIRGVKVRDYPEDTVTGGSDAPGSVTGVTELDFTTAADDSAVSFTAKGKQTVGYQTISLGSVALPSGSLAAPTIAILATDGAKKFYQRWAADSVVSTIGGSLSTVGTSPTTGRDFPLTPTVAPAYDGTAGTLAINATGPHADVVGTSNAGGGTGKVRVQVSSSTPLTSWVGTIAVDISDIVGTTEANGSNLAATYVDSTHFDLLAIAFVNAWTSGGLVVEHTPRTLAWSAALRMEAIVP